jgi:hypothetical protein
MNRHHANVMTAVFETLQQRRLLSASIDGGGVLNVIGTSSSDAIFVTGNTTSVLVKINTGTTMQFDRSAVTSIRIDAQERYVAVGGIEIARKIYGGEGKRHPHRGAAPTASTPATEHVILGPERQGYHYGEGGDAHPPRRRAATRLKARGNTSSVRDIGDDHATAAMVRSPRGYRQRHPAKAARAGTSSLATSATIRSSAAAAMM